MSEKQIFERYYSRLAKEGMIKAVLCALAIGLGLAFAASLIFWFTDFKYFWVAIIIGVAAVAAISPVFYLKLFRPTAKSVAHRVDRLGLEERIITMTELENDQSYIAMRQREDAHAALVAARDRKIVLKVPAKFIITASVVAVAFFAMLLVNILSLNGVVPKASEIIDDITEPDTVYHSVTYLCEGDGYIDGDDDQVVADGESSATVIAVAEDGWFFYKWSDDFEEAERTEFNVIDDMEITAIFVELDESETDGDGDGEGEDGEQGEGDPGEPSEGNGEGNGDQSNPSNPSNDPSDGDGAGSSDDKQDDTFIDGNTPIKDVYDQYYEEAMKLLSEGKDLPDDLRQIIEGYFNGLLP